MTLCPCGGRHHRDVFNNRDRFQFFYASHLSTTTATQIPIRWFATIVAIISATSAYAQQHNFSMIVLS